MRRYLDEFTGLWRALAREGPAARSDAGVSLPRQLWELLVLRLGEGKLHPHDYYKLRVYRRGLRFDEKRKYFSNQAIPPRSEEHTSELQSLMRISYAVFCLKTKKQITQITKK